jgi:hypothetical protein
MKMFIEGLAKVSKYFITAKGEDVLTQNSILRRKQKDN